ncbi:hypothetical protein Bbelb_109890 [Branchiostoma belcheri]|nr:hypothetical protein Bbelb_109890 [Branchiostoma belcheri]
MHSPRGGRDAGDFIHGRLGDAEKGTHGGFNDEMRRLEVRLAAAYLEHQTGATRRARRLVLGLCRIRAAQGAETKVRSALCEAATTRESVGSSHGSSGWSTVETTSTGRLRGGDGALQRMKQGTRIHNPSPVAYISTNVSDAPLLRAHASTTPQNTESPPDYRCHRDVVRLSAPTEFPIRSPSPPQCSPPESRPFGCRTFKSRIRTYSDYPGPSRPTAPTLTFTSRPGSVREPDLGVDAYHP